ncbi:MAG: phosphatase PAP2 family protein [Lachnospiraceae bacterium]|nr:phosphatase PAP2 family protein [Lachnospiraceae bacterium]MCI9306644.1 phosphatase PAP2 family protein [Lachnospiraceae bacterium]
MKALWKKYRHALVLLYGLIYMPWFIWLESRANLPYHVIHVRLDDLIPFSEVFIVPYLLWFVYVAAVFVYLFFQFDKKKEFYQYCIFLFTGMTLFLVVSTVYPNGHLLRPASFERHNIFTFAVQMLYRTDTATNIFPSIHVFNSIAAHVAVAKNRKLGGNIWIRGGSFLLMVSIILATMFLKQHSVLDVIAGTLLGVLMEQLVYHTDFSFARSGRRKPVGA